MFDPLTTQSRNLDPRFTCYRHQPHLRFALHHTNNSSDASHTIREYCQTKPLLRTPHIHIQQQPTWSYVLHPRPVAASQVASSHTDTITARQGRALRLRRGTRFVQTFNTSVTSWLIDHSLRLPRRRATLHWPHVGASISHPARSTLLRTRPPPLHRYRLHRWRPSNMPHKPWSKPAACFCTFTPHTSHCLSTCTPPVYPPVPIHAQDTS
jgi:hypothetical protein